MDLGNFKNSNTFRVLFIGFLILLLLIPMGMVESVIAERDQLYRQANHEITASWGREQIFTGPILTIPYVKTSSTNAGWSYVSQYKHISPKSMVITAHVETQIRYRSIYKVPVYTTSIEVHGNFGSITTNESKDDDKAYKFSKGIIQIPINISRSLKEAIQFTWDDEVINLTPSWDNSSNEAAIFSAKIPEHLLDNDKTHKFKLRMKLAGKRSTFIYFIITKY